MRYQGEGDHFNDDVVDVGTGPADPAADGLTMSPEDAARLGRWEEDLRWLERSRRDDGDTLVDTDHDVEERDPADKADTSEPGMDQHRDASVKPVGRTGDDQSTYEAPRPEREDGLVSKGLDRQSKAVGAIAFDGCDLDTAVEVAEVRGHVVGNGSDREITADFSQQYGHKAVALSEELTRAVIEEDVEGERKAKEQLAAELESHRKDFAEWEAGLRTSKSDASFEATGIVDDFNALDRPFLPVTLTNEPAEITDPQAVTAPGSPKSEAEGQPSAGAGRDLFSWLGGMSDDQLVNYFQWSEARTDAVSAALATQREAIQHNVRGALDNIITAGLAPEDARAALEQSFEHTAIFGALSSFESGFYQADGLYETVARRLGTRREYGVDEVEQYAHKMRDVHVHESFHAYDNANGTGLTYLLSNDEVPLVWVDEAVKEHLSEAGTSGQPHVLNPYDRYTEGAYKDIRELLYLVLTTGDDEIPLCDLMAANFERHNVEGPKQAREALVAQLRANYQDLLPELPPGETILHVIAREINAAPKPLASQVTREWIQKVSEWRDENPADDWSLVG